MLVTQLEQPLLTGFYYNLETGSLPIVWTPVLSLKAGGLVLDVTMENRMQNHSKRADGKQASKKKKKKKPSPAGVKTWIVGWSDLAHKKHI